MAQGVNVVPLLGGQQTTVGGVSLYGQTENDETDGQNAPTKSVEGGYVLTTKVGPKPTEGQITAWVASSDLPSIKRFKNQREPVPITTPEGSYSTCVVEEISRKTQGKSVDAYLVTIQWREILQASTSTSTIRAVTTTGPKSPKAGSSNHNKGNYGIVTPDRRNVSNGPNTGTAAKNAEQKSDGGVLDTAENVFNGVSNEIQSWFGGGGEQTTAGMKR